MSTLRLTLGYLLVLLLFVLVGAIAAATAPIAWFAGHRVYAAGVTRALSRMTAAFFGKSGRYTASAECGAAKRGGFLRLRRVVDAVLGEGHCEREARNEGRIP